jgi:membrane-associated phospholipid phosphatase
LICGLEQLDLRASTRLRRLPHARGVDRALATASRLTDHGRAWYVLGVAGAALDQRRRRDWVAATATVVLTERASEVIKHATMRERPSVDGLPHLATTPSRFSFPSSHTADAVAGSLVFGRVLPTLPLRVFALTQSASRPYLGVHYVSDVLAGAALGAVIGRAVRRWAMLTPAR